MWRRWKQIEKHGSVNPGTNAKFNKRASKATQQKQHEILKLMLKIAYWSSIIKIEKQVQMTNI